MALEHQWCTVVNQSSGEPLNRDNNGQITTLLCLLLCDCLPAIGVCMHGGCFMCSVNTSDQSDTGCGSFESSLRNRFRIYVLKHTRALMEPQRMTFGPLCVAQVTWTTSSNLWPFRRNSLGVFINSLKRQLSTFGKHAGCNPPIEFTKRKVTKSLSQDLFKRAFRFFFPPHSCCYS